MGKKRTKSSFVQIDRFAGRIFDIRFTTWGDLQLNIGADHGYQKEGEEWKDVGDNFYLQLTIPQGHDAFRLVESGELAAYEKGVHKGRIYVSNGGVQFTVKKYEKRDGTLGISMNARAAPWTLISSSPGGAKEKKAEDPEVVTELPEEIPF